MNRQINTRQTNRQTDRQTDCHTQTNTKQHISLIHSFTYKSPLDPIINVTITPPHAVTLNSMVTFHCQPIDKFNTTTTTTVPQLGPVHYEWLFQDTGALNLTRNKTLTHVFPTTGRFRVSLSAFNPVSTKATHVYINVYSQLL